MSSESESSLRSAPPRRASSAWLYLKALWAGLSIVTMWLVVLFVGLFGGNIVNSTPGGSTSSVPVVVVVVPFVLAATIVVARRGFRETSQGEIAAPHGEEPAARETPAGEPPALRSKAA